MSNHYQDLFQTFRKNDVQITLARLGTDPDTPLSALEQARVKSTLAQALEDGTAWPSTWHLLDKAAPKMEQAGEREAWSHLLERGIEVCKQRSEQEAEARLSIHLGEQHRLMNRLDSSEMLFKHSLQIAEQYNEPTAQGLALNRLAILALAKSQYAQAQNLSRSALEILPLDHVDSANSFYVLGTTKYEIGDPKEAAPLLEKSCSIWKESGSKRKYAWGLRNLGPALRLSGRLDEAMVCNEKAYIVLQEIGDSQNLAITQMNLGIIHSNLQNYENAISLYEEATLIFQELGDYLNLARAYGNMGTDYRALGNPEESERALKQSISLAHQAQHERTICNSLLELWVTYRQSHNNQEKACLDSLMNRLALLGKNLDTQVLAAKFISEIGETMGKLGTTTSP